MIEFTCSGCGRPFTVPDHFAGRQARCKSCGTPVTVPATAAPVAVGAADEAAADHVEVESASAETIAPPRRIPMRIRRLTADADQMSAAFANFPAIRVLATEGTPPEVYQIEYRIKSLDRGKKRDVPIPRDQHRVEIRLTSEYPRQSPQCKMLTPIFHPNIDPSHICVGDHWAAGERLVDLVIRIGELIAFQAYNIKSPLDAEAAMWADLHQADLPTDSQTLRPANLG